MKCTTRLAALIVLLCLGSLAQATITIETVTIGNPGNIGELSGVGAGGSGDNRVCGAVDYLYNSGKFEITATQYTAFLNAVAKTDTYGLYNTEMWSSARGCKIQRSGTSGNYTYAVATDYANRPVNFVSWGDSARFTNWLTNGQPTGAQNLTTTEDGSYYLNGVNTEAGLAAVVRKTLQQGGRYYIPSEDEWYKAAYYDPNKPGGAGYWDYPTGTDTIPSNLLVSPDPGNNANFYKNPPGNTIGAPYYRTEVGDFENSESPYGTFDQGGNVMEWTEAQFYTGNWWYQQRGGFYDNFSTHMQASWRSDKAIPTAEVGSFGYFGFRITEAVPEPASFLVLGSGILGLAGMIRRRRNG